MERFPVENGGAEARYDRAARYLFARGFLEGKSVVDLGCRDGYGTRLLSQVAERAFGIDPSEEAVSHARSRYEAPNLSYEVGELADTSHGEGSLDAAVSFGFLEEPGTVAAEARRILKDDGVFVVSVPDRRASGGGRGMYVPDFREMLERRFERVELFRQGAVAGGLVFAEGGDLSSTERAPFEEKSPETRFVIAVCGVSEASARGGERALLVLDPERGIFDERDELSDDLGLMREEIRQIQETEVQTFHDTIKARDARIAELKNETARLHRRITNIENSRVWRMFSLYRRLRSGGRNGEK